MTTGIAWLSVEPTEVVLTALYQEELRVPIVAL